MAFGGYLKQSTAVDILLGPFLDDADGDTADTDATIDVELSKNGQALADSESAAPTHDAAGTVDGYYNCVLGTTDTNTLGILTVVAHHADDLPVRLDYQVVTANWYDTMCSTDNLDVNVTAIAADVITPASVDEDADFIIQALSITNALDAGSVLVDGTTTLTGNVSCAAALDVVGAATAGSVSIDAGMDVVGALSANSLLVDTTSTLTGNVSLGGTLGVTGISTFTGAVNAAITGNITGDLSGTTGEVASVAGDVKGNVDGSVATCPAATVSAIDNIDFGATMKASINTEVDSALDTAIPAAPTADSMNQYIHQLKWVLTNLMVITEATGNVVGYKDDDVSAAYTVAAAFASAAGVTTRKRLE